MSKQSIAKLGAIFGAGVMCLTLLPVNSADARPGYLNRIPAQDAGCDTCHMGNDRSMRNDFGKDFNQAGLMWTEELGGKDSDGDGFNNAIELGDVNLDGVSENGYQSNPGDATSKPQVADPCGNGMIDAGEECDGANLDSKTCADFNNQEGTLSCTSECKIDSSQCMPAAMPDMGGGDTDMGNNGNMDMGGQNTNTSSTSTGSTSTSATNTTSTGNTSTTGGTSTNTGVIASPDMGGNGGSDMGGGSTGGTPVATTSDDGDDGCAQAGNSSPSVPVSLMFLAGGLVWLRRKLRK